MKLRPYQLQGFGDIAQAWLEWCVIMFVLATGGGKTVTFVEVARKAVLQGKRVLIVAHREELILQAWRTLYANKMYAGIIMAGYPEQHHLAVQVCSIQTIVRRKVWPPADVVIIDEGHHAQPDNSYGQLFRRPTYYNSKFLVVTATPYRLSGDGFTSLHPGKPTKLIINRTLKQLTDDGWLVPLRYFAASVPDLSNVHLQKGDYVEEEAKKAMELAPIIESYMEHARGKRGVVFCVNRQHSREVVEQYLRAGVRAVHLDGETPDEERTAIYNDFKAGLIDVICNVGIVTEGADFPMCEFVQLARPTMSLGLVLQMIGRVTRALDGLLDGLETKEERIAAIAASAKPCGIILDNAGCWVEHGLPDMERDWERHFRGYRKERKQAEEEMMEMLVFVVEDKNGRRTRVTTPEEAEGKKLVEVTTETRRKLINFTSIKEFDRLYAIFKNQNKIARPGIVALQSFMQYCKKQNILITDDIWDYLYKKLVADIEDKTDTLRQNRALNPNSYPVNNFGRMIDQIDALGLRSGHFKRVRAEYERDNQKEILEHRFGVRVPESGKLIL